MFGFYEYLEIEAWVITHWHKKFILQFAIPIFPIYWLLLMCCIWKIRNWLKVEIGGSLSTDRNLRWESCDRRLGSGSHTFWYSGELQYFKCLSELCKSCVNYPNYLEIIPLRASQTPLQIVFLLSVNVDWEFRPRSHKHFNVVKNSIRDRKLI